MKEKNEYYLQTSLTSISVGLLTLAFILAKTGRDALFFQGRGLFQLPVAYMTIGMSSIPAALLIVKAMKTWGTRPTRLGALIVTAAVLAAFVPFLEPGNYPVLMSLFVFVPIVFGTLFASLWLLASDLFENAPKTVTARSFSRIGASSLAGGMAGGLLSKGLADHLDPKWLILLAVPFLLMVVGLVAKTHQTYPTTLLSKRNQDERKGVSFSTVFSKKYARSLLLISMLAALAGSFVDFQFYAAAISGGMDSQGNTNFFASFYIMLNLCSLLVQLFAAPSIQDKVGLRGGLLILPLALLGGAGFVTIAATALSRSILKVTEGGLKASIHRSAWEQAFIFVDSDERSSVKVFVDGLGAHIAEGLGAAALFIWLMRVDKTNLSSLNTEWMAWVVVIAVVFWLLLTRNLCQKVVEESSTIEPEVVPPQERESQCRFPHQCPCTTEWARGIR